MTDTVQFVYVFVDKSMGTKTKEFPSPYNGLTYTNVRKKSRSMVWILDAEFFFSHKNVLTSCDSCVLLVVK